MIDFLGIGAQKSGTTWLHRQLSQHPDAFLPVAKEIHFWNRRRNLGLGWYESVFAEAKPGQKKGEITPAYAVLPRAVIRRVHQASPDVRLFFLMRDPVDRAWSAALMHLRVAGMKYENTPDEVILSHLHSEGSIARGDYRACLNRWWSVFSKDQTLVGLMEDMKDDPKGLISRCFTHAGLSDISGELPGLEERVGATRDIALPERFETVLWDIYRDKISALETFLDRDLDVWRRRPMAQA